jgi:hypothetical protein
VRLRPYIGTVILIAFAAAPIWAQGEASGGKTTSKAATDPKSNSATPPAAKKPVKTNVTPAANSTAPRATAALDRIDGKWWTTGNGFGDSEVVFTQTGAQVSGAIAYADGRTGTVNGTLIGKRLQFTWTNSSGDGGSGWLELSWNNFLGGPWHNQRVRDGSWTLARFAGKWCFGGSRSRIRTVTHDARGRITMVAEDGDQEEGRLEGPYIFLESDMATIKGTVNFKANRIDWSTGFFWTWCGR